MRPPDDSLEVDFVDFSVTGPYDSRYRFVMAALILAAHFSVGLNVFAVSPVLLLVIEDLNISRTTASLLVALPLLISAVFGLPGSVLVMKLGLRRAFILGWAAMGLLVLSAVASGFWPLLALRLVYGLGSSLILTAAGPLLMQWFKPKEVTIMNGLDMAALSLGIALSVWLAAPLAGLAGWQGMLGLIGVVGLAGTFAWTLLGRSPGFEDGQEGGITLGEIPRVLSNRAILLLLAADAGVLVQYTALASWLPSFFVEVRGMTLSRAGFVTGLVPFVGVLGVLLGGVLPLKIDSNRLFLVAPGAMIVLGGLGAFGSGNIVVIYISLGLVGLGSWLYVPTLLSMSMQIVGRVPGRVAIVWGSLITFSGMGMFISPILVGFLRDSFGSFYPGFILCSLGAWALLLAGILMPKNAAAPLGQEKRPTADRTL